MNGRGTASLPRSVACDGSEWPQAGVGLCDPEETLDVPQSGVPRSEAWEKHTQASVGGECSSRIQDLGHVSG